MLSGQFWEPLAEHMMLTAIPLIVAIVVAWPVSHLLARTINLLRSRVARPAALEWLIPWRAFLVTSVVMSLPFVPAIFILENPFLIFVSGMTIASFLLALTLLTGARSNRVRRGDEASRILSAIRTLAVVMIGLAVPGYRYFPSGAGFMIVSGREKFDFETMWTGVLVLAAASVVVDLLLGVLVYVRAVRSEQVEAEP